METNELLERRLSDVEKATNHQKPGYIPVHANLEPGVIGISGHTLTECLYDIDAYKKNMGVFYDRVYCDTSGVPMVTATPCAVELFGSAQFRIGPDGCTIEHMADPKMRDDEYPELLSNYDGFIEKLVQRKYPDFFNLSLEEAKEKTKCILNEAGYMMTVLDGAHREMLEERGIAPILGGYCPNPGIDAIFDTLRGFKGTMLDLRRHYEEVKAAGELLWSIRSEPMLMMPPEFGPTIYQQVPHIPTYLKPKQFEELYLPQMKQALELIIGYESKLCVVLEGSWLKFLDYFMDAPKDSMILMVDDDDILEVHKKIGDRQTVAGGAKLTMLKTDSTEHCIDYAKRVIDECGRDGGLIFTVDKPLLSPSDCCDNLYKVFEFAHEYGKC